MPDACQAHQRQHSQTFSLFILAFQHVLVLTSMFWDAMRTGLSLDSFMWDCLWTSLVNITRAPLLPSTEDCTSKCPSGRQRYGTVCGQWNCPRRWRVSLLRPDTLTHASLVCLFYHRTGGPHVSDGVVSCKLTESPNDHTEQNPTGDPLEECDVNKAWTSIILCHLDLGLLP